jgi:hypothetical protein
MPSRVRHPFERLVRCRMVANADSIRLLVRMLCQCWAASLMSLMPPPTGIVMCHCDVLESITQRESIDVKNYLDRHRRWNARVSTSRGLCKRNGYFSQETDRVQRLAFMSQQLTCIVAMLAGATAHCWGRETETPGHTVRLIAPNYLKPFAKRQKNDVADAEAIVEAASRPTMRFVALKSEAQQARAKPRPAMVWLQTMRGLLHDRIRSHTQTVQKSLAPTGASIHAQICLRLGFLLPRTNLGHCVKNATSLKAIEDCSKDLNLRNSLIEVPHGTSLTE